MVSKLLILLQEETGPARRRTWFFVVQQTHVNIYIYIYIYIYIFLSKSRVQRVFLGKYRGRSEIASQVGVGGLLWVSAESGTQHVAQARTSLCINSDSESRGFLRHLHGKCRYI
jgi:hypothetical protein